jgi:hypothetical protein
MSTYNVALELDAKVLRKSNAVIEKALRDGNHKTRAQLKAALDKAGFNTAGTQRLARMVMQAEVDGIICSGPRVGKQMTYALLAERAPTQRNLRGDEALFELTRRYFASRAPATVHDFAWWSGLTITDCKRGIAMAHGELAPVELADKTYWAPPGFSLPSRIPTTAHLLPNYDEYFIGFRDRSAIGQRLESAHLVTGGNALIANVVVIDGQLVGGWRRSQDATSIAIAMNLLTKLTPAERTRLDKTVARYARFVGVRVHVDNIGRR